MPFLFIVMLMHIVFTGGQGLKLGFVNFSYEGIFRGGIFSLRLIVMLLFASIFGWTTKPVELASALEQNLSFLSKIGLSLRDICTSLLITMRFIPEVFNDISRIRMAQKARGLKVSGNLYQRIKSVIPLIIPLFIRAFRRADTIALALELKGYHSKGKRTFFVSLYPKLGDYIGFALICSFLLIVGLISLRFAL